MLAQTFSVAQAFEAIMLICFGLGWPVAIIKTLRTRRTEGKSLGFLILVLIGYISGIVAKLVSAYMEAEPIQAVTALYAVNAALVAADILLYLRYNPKMAKND